MQYKWLWIKASAKCININAFHVLPSRSLKRHGHGPPAENLKKWQAFSKSRNLKSDLLAAI